MMTTQLQAQQRAAAFRASKVDKGKRKGEMNKRRAIRQSESNIENRGDYPVRGGKKGFEKEKGPENQGEKGNTCQFPADPLAVVYKPRKNMISWKRRGEERGSVLRETNRRGKGGPSRRVILNSHRSNTHPLRPSSRKEEEWGCVWKEVKTGQYITKQERWPATGRRGRLLDQIGGGEVWSNT